MNTKQPIGLPTAVRKSRLSACVVSIQGNKPKQLMRRSRLGRTVRGDIRRLHIVHVLAAFEEEAFIDDAAVNFDIYPIAAFETERSPAKAGPNMASSAVAE